MESIKSSEKRGKKYILLFHFLLYIFLVFLEIPFMTRMLPGWPSAWKRPPYNSWRPYASATRCTILSTATLRFLRDSFFVLSPRRVICSPSKKFMTSKRRVTRPGMLRGISIFFEMPLCLCRAALLHASCKSGACAGNGLMAFCKRLDAAGMGTGRFRQRQGLCKIYNR